MVDYSKWDKFGEDLSDEEDGAKSDPTVTRLSTPSKVTFGGENNSQVTIEESVIHSSSSAVDRSQPLHSQKLKAKWDRSLLSKNGIDYGTYAWAQDLNQLYLSVFVEAGTRGKEVMVTLSETGTLVARNVIKDEVIIEGQLVKDVWGASKARVTYMKLNGKQDAKSFDEARFSGKISESEKEAKEMEWELKDWIENNGESGRILEIRLYKLPPHELIKGEWWEKVFAHEEKKSDIESIPDRKHANNITSSSFKEAWEEAHRQFKENRRNKPKQVIS
mmetsp:Transcript_1703/g.2419  ORF Transcript_1703/g.2419 Transcript_1703/m.2419 type:complete len:276 (-) Transcript_1703:939-1766(-)